MDEEKKQIEVDKFEEYVYSVLPDLPNASLRRLKKMVRQALSDRNWERRLDRMGAKDVERLEEQIAARKRKDAA